MIISALVCSACLQAQPTDPRVDAAIDRSRTTSATYSVFAWNEANTDDRGRVSEWSAEFHRGNLHRVETPLHRIIADCSAQTGTYFNVTTKERVTGPQVAKAACGVNANATVISSRFLGRQASRFGAVDRIELTDDEGIRTYDIDHEGALLAATYTGIDGELSLEAQAIARLATADGDIFSEQSLDRSAVPETYQVKPKSAE